jgi:hypothetical protein
MRETGSAALGLSGPLEKAKSRLLLTKYLSALLFDPGLAISASIVEAAELLFRWRHQILSVKSRTFRLRSVISDRLNLTYTLLRTGECYG